MASSLPLDQQFAQVLAHASRLLTPLSDAQVNWRPQPGAWSVGECLDHLTLTAAKFRTCLDSAVAVAQANAWTYAGPSQPGPLGRLVLWIMEPPVRFAKAKATAELSPQPNRPARLVLTDFLTAHQSLAAALPAYTHWDLNRTKVESPLVVKHSLGVVLAFLPAHCRRHLWQAEQVTQAPNFPSA